MKINHKNCTIELTKTEMKAAETFGSQMYKDLREARQDNPNYRVKVVTPSKKVDRHKGLSADAMKKFIQKHDDKNQTILKEFYQLRGLTPEGEKDEFGYLEKGLKQRVVALNLFLKDIYSFRNL